MQELSIAPPDHHNLLRIGNFIAIFESGLSFPRSSIADLLLLQQWYQCMWLRRRKVVISNDTEEQNWCGGARANEV